MEVITRSEEGPETSEISSSVRSALKYIGLEETKRLQVQELRKRVSRRLQDHTRRTGVHTSKNEKSHVEDKTAGTEGVQEIKTDKAEERMGNEKDDQEGDVFTNVLEELGITSDDSVSANDLVELTETLAKGELPKPHLSLKGDTLNSFQKASLFEKVTKFPKETLEYLKYYILLQASQKGTKWIKALIPRQQIQTLVLIYILTLITRSALLFLVPLVSFYICFTSMVVFTLQMFYGRSLYSKITSIQNFLTAIDPVETRVKEKHFHWDAKVPYIGFLVSCLIAAGILTLCDKNFIPSSLLCVISILMSATTVRSFSPSLGKMNFVNDVADVSLLLVRAVSSCTELFSLQLIKVQLTDTVSMHLNIGGMIEGLLIIGIIILAFKVSSSGIDASLGVIISSLLSLLWFQMGLQLFASSTWKGIFQVTLGWLLVIVAMPVLALYLVLHVGYVALQSFASFSFTAKLGVAFLVIVISTVAMIYSRFQSTSFVRILLAVFAMLLCLAGGLFLITLSHYHQHQSKLSLDKYCNECRPSSSIEFEKAKLAMACSMYLGKQVSWSGVIETSTTTLQENTAYNIVRKFPYWLQAALKCIVGQTNEPELLYAIAKDQCHLSSFDKYAVSLSVMVGCPATANRSIEELQVILQSDKRIIKYLKYLGAGVKVQFNATILSGFGTERLVMDLRYIQLIEKSLMLEEEEPISELVLRALMSMVRFVLGPAIALIV